MCSFFICSRSHVCDLCWVLWRCCASLQTQFGMLSRPQLQPQLPLSLSHTESHPPTLFLLHTATPAHASSLVVDVHTRTHAHTFLPHLTPTVHKPPISFDTSEVFRFAGFSANVIPPVWTGPNRTNLCARRVVCERVCDVCVCVGGCLL